MEYATRRAIPEDLDRLGQLFAESLERERRTDPLLLPAGGDWRPCLQVVLRRKELLLVVLECAGALEGYALARRELMTGPRPRPSLLRLLLKLPRPRPVLAPFLAVWIDDLHLTAKGRQAGGAPALGRAVQAWARSLGAHRLGITVAESREEALELARHLEMKERRTFHTVDLK